MREPPNLIELLLTKFPITKHPVYGNCIIIYKPKYKREWTEQLQKLGSRKFVEVDHVYVQIPASIQIPQHKLPERDGKQEVSKPAVITKKSDASPPGTAVISDRVSEIIHDPPAPPSKSKSGQKSAKRKKSHKAWSNKEEKLLIKIAKDRTLSMKQIYDKYLEEKGKKWTARSFSSVKGHISELRQKGVISHRYKQDKKVSIETQPHEESTVEPAEPEAPVVETPAKENGKHLDSSPGKLTLGENLQCGIPCSVIVFDQSTLRACIRREDVECWKELWRALQR